MFFPLSGHKTTVKMHNFQTLTEKVVGGMLGGLKLGKTSIFFISLLVHPILTCGYLKQFLFWGNLWSSACIVAEMIAPQRILHESHKSFLYGL